MDWTSIISLILNLALGGGLFVSLATIKSQKRKVAAEAQSTELGNVQEVISMWRELADSLKKDLEESKSNSDKMSENYLQLIQQVESLKKEIIRLRQINLKMLELLDKITPENLEQIIEKIKKIHNENPDNYIVNNLNG